MQREDGAGGIGAALRAWGLLVAVLASFVGCAGDRAVPAADRDASVAASPTELVPALELATSLAGKQPDLAARLAPSVDGWLDGDEGVTSPGWRGASRGPAYDVGARLPRRADLPIEVGIGKSDAYRLRLQPVGAEGAALSIDAGRAVFAGAYRSTDVVYVAEPTRIEWMYVLRDASAPHEFALQLELPPTLRGSRPEADGSLSILDQGGTPRLRVTRPVAIDAHGTRREGSLAFDGAEMTIALDATDLAFPILLDPAIETPVWEVRQTPPEPRYYPAMAYDVSRKRLVLFGGISMSGSNAQLADTWEWDGSTWTLRSTTGPQARNSAAMAYDDDRKRTVLFGGSSGSTRLNDTWEWDGTVWMAVCTTAPCSASKPTARDGAAMAYDRNRKKSVLFGGYDGADTADTWEWDGSAWKKSAAAGPSAREAAGLAWDAAGGKVLLFGGANGSTLYDDTWTFDGTSWTQVAVGAGPSARSYPQMAGAWTKGRVVLYGGYKAGYLADTWEWNGTQWTLVFGLTPPPGNAYGAMAFDSANGIAVLFGGTGIGTGTWLYDFATWQQPSTYPVARYSQSMAYDPTRGRTVMFGGFAGGASPGLDDTWEWTGNTWLRACKSGACAASAPSARWYQAMTYDAAAGVTLMFGGNGSNELWQWDGSTWLQLCTSAPCSTGSKPSGRDLATLAYDSYRSRTVMFGGRVGAAAANDTWEWNGSTWLQMCTMSPCNATVPSARYWSSMVFDPVRKVSVLFGGYDGTNRYADTWEWNGAKWTQRATTGPSARYGAAIAYDPMRRRTVLFGGSTSVGPPYTSSETWEWDGSAWALVASSGPSSRMSVGAFDLNRERFVVFGGIRSNSLWGDTWEYYSRGGACSGAGQCDTGYCTDGVCCEALSCGTCQACNTSGNPGVCAPVTNADDLDTCTGPSTCSAFGECKLKNAQSCTTASQCASGYCVDGVCCESACAGGCDVCNTTPGTCTKLASGAVGTSCGGYKCDGSSADCPTSCANDADCQLGYFCAVDGTCQNRRAKGSPCNTGAGGNCKVADCRECKAGLACADFYCCDSTCDGSCQTCAATPGTCTTVTSADDGDTCTGASTCDSTGQCLKKNGETCSAAAECASGKCADGYCCNSACSGACDTCSATPGTCTLLAAGSSGSPACGAYVCSGSSGACATSCGNDADCASNYYCAANGTCQARKGQASACNAAAGADCKSAGCRVCQSNNCIDGYCCDSACGGACDACNGGALGWSGASNGTCAVAPSGSAGNPACSIFTCDGTSASCGTACTSDTQCVSGYYCSSSGACLPQRTQAQSCNLATDCKVAGNCRECATGFCVDGVCCNSACSGSCDTCNASGSIGSCTLLSAGSSGSPACSPYLCNGSSASCGSSCTSDAQCVSSHFCDTGSGTCKPDQAAGGKCTSGAQCQSGLSCADGVCCDSACNGTCQACTAAKKGSGTDGTCGNIANGTDPDAECGDDGASSCQRDGLCNGAGACRLYANGTTCGASVCSSGTQTPKQCNGTGSCIAGATKQCSPYVCADATSCATSCTTDAQCVATSWCRISDGTCQPDQANGLACSSASQCTSGNCVDGVCCDTACNGTCQACTAALKGSGSNGTCGSIGAGKDPQNECPDDGDDSCGRNGVCNGGGACQLYASGTTCGTTTCSGGTQTGYACDGLGTCKAGSTTACAPYVCGATACKSTCAADADCVATSFCRVGDGTCQPDQANGAACTAASQCASGNCVDGICCDSPCTGSCQACSASKKGAGVDGACGYVKTDTDPDNECTGSAASTCQQTGNCDGKGGCKLYALGTVCGATTCANGVQTGYQCDGFGACGSGSTTLCTPYTCSGSVCGTTCNDDAGCIAADWCRTSDGTCQPDQAKGAACTSSSQCASGNCVDGFCCDAPCNGLCQACSAAKKGSGADGVCGNIAVDADPDNECTSDSPTTCKQTGSCDGAGGCKKYSSGTSCGSTTCANGVQTGYQCDGFGTCQTGTTTQCAPYVCADASACATSCSGDAACVTSAFCDATTGTCKSDQVNGAACTSASQCISGFCVDGVCCDQACGGLCQACTAALKGSGANGVCGAIAKGGDPQAECADEGASSCQRDGFCDGKGACELYVQGTACGATTCANGTQTGYACDGLGTCKAAADATCAPYTCQGQSCGATCASDADCVASHYCRITDGTCRPDQTNGAACTLPTQCTSGNCVDGVCCDSPCGGACQACTATKKGSGADGVCGSVGAGTDPDDECPDDGAGSCQRDGFCSGLGTCRLYGLGSACGATTCSSGTQTGYACDGAGTCTPGQSAQCSPYVCQGGACGTVCASDVDCVAAAYCASDSTCKADQANGASCTAASQCTSGFCVDGVCCNAACDGTCQACSAAKKGSGIDGTCESVGLGTDPDNDCTADPPSTCGNDGQCDGAGKCRRYAPGTSCGANTCSGSTLTGKQCDGFGTCVDGQTAQCDPFVCSGTTCAISCADDAGCVPGAFCGNDSQCHDRLVIAAACTSDHECKSGFCVEGLCCDTKCDGTCQACTAATKASGSGDGLCGDAKPGSDPHDDCTDDGQSTCLHDGTCDGQGACRFYEAGVACGATDCQGNVQTGHACNGSGICLPDAQTDCAPFACSVGACRTSCAADTDCASSAYCDGATSTCVPKTGDGTACTSAATCASGFCVDGVCCDQACGGQCEACDVSTAKGKCSPVVGDPHGGRPKCAAGTGETGDEVCAGRTCDGAKNTSSCVGYVGSEIGCRGQSCAAGEETFSATCNGQGQCGPTSDAKITRACEPYACGTTACKDQCSADVDCAPGYRCDTASGKCISGATCDGDHTIKAPGQAPTDCRPYRCESGGTCKTSCASIDDCVEGFVCSADGRCASATVVTSDAGDGGGCGCRTASTGVGAGAWAWALAALAWGARRRRGARHDRVPSGLT